MRFLLEIKFHLLYSFKQKLCLRRWKGYPSFLSKTIFPEKCTRECYPLLWLSFPLSQSCHLTFSKWGACDETSKQECTYINHLKVQPDNICWAAHQSGRLSGKCALKGNFGEIYIYNAVCWGNWVQNVSVPGTAMNFLGDFVGPTYSP